MNLIKYCLAICISLILLFSLNSAVADKNDEFIVIVNKSNNESTLHRVQLKRIFLRKVRTWENGNEIKPVEQDIDSITRRAFSIKIIGKDVEIVLNYWHQQIFTGRGVPPPVLASDKEVIDFIKSNPDAIGYISRNAISPEVKMVNIIH